MIFGSSDDHEMKCSFCGKLQEQVGRLFSGPGVYICDECVELCGEMIDRGKQESFAADFKDVPKPKEICRILDQYVIGQDEAKKSLSVAVYNHYKRVSRPAARESPSGGGGAVELTKSNILMLGPTGSGKTLLAQTLARTLNVPFAIADATTLTEAGYVGEDVENILLKLIQAADYDIPKAQKGIVYIDEIDKIARRGENMSITRDVSGEGVQQALLKILEGTVASVPPQGGRKHPTQEVMQIDTTDILFICGGAFDGIERIIEERLGQKRIGFGAETKPGQAKRSIGETLRLIMPEDLLRHGLIPEFVGRLPIVVTLDALDEEALVRILTEPRNALIRQYQELMAMDGVRLTFDEASLRLIAHDVLTRKTGARGLRAVIEKIMRNVMFEVPSIDGVTTCQVTEDVVSRHMDPVLTIDQGKALAQHREQAAIA